MFSRLESGFVCYLSSPLAPVRLWPTCRNLGQHHLGCCLLMNLRACNGNCNCNRDLGCLCDDSRSFVVFTPYGVTLLVLVAVLCRIPFHPMLSWTFEMLHRAGRGGRSVGSVDPLIRLSIVVMRPWVQRRRAQGRVETETRNQGVWLVRGKGFCVSIDVAS